MKEGFGYGRKSRCFRTKHFQGTGGVRTNSFQSFIIFVVPMGEYTIISKVNGVILLDWEFRFVATVPNIFLLLDFHAKNLAK